MNVHGRHLLAEFRGCDFAALDDIAFIEKHMNEAALASGCTIVQSNFHEFAPQGVSGVVVIAESHLSIHTWPELGYAAVDFYTCGEDSYPDRAAAYLERALGATEVELLTVLRGQRMSAPSMKIESHTVECRDHAVADIQTERPEAASC